MKSVGPRSILEAVILNHQAFTISVRNVGPRAVLEDVVLNHQAFTISVGSVGPRAILEAMILNNRAFTISVGSVGFDGTRSKAVAICHTDTAHPTYTVISPKNNGKGLSNSLPHE
ncbi:hypothetical protein GOBAR_DD10112 [Gossypium barbadense]|nr:hypothetical protein GOBAR_DD10112 [Gossypium barbadense]